MLLMATPVAVLDLYRLGWLSIGNASLTPLPRVRLAPPVLMPWCWAFQAGEWLKQEGNHEKV